VAGAGNVALEFECARLTSTLLIVRPESSLSDKKKDKDKLYYIDG